MGFIELHADLPVLPKVPPELEVPDLFAFPFILVPLPAEEPFFRSSQVCSGDGGLFDRVLGYNEHRHHSPSPATSTHHRHDSEQSDDPKVKQEPMDQEDNIKPIITEHQQLRSTPEEQLGPIVGASVGGYYVNPRLRGYCVTPIRDTVELVCSGDGGLFDRVLGYNEHRHHSPSPATSTHHRHDSEQSDDPKVKQDPMDQEDNIKPIITEHQQLRSTPEEQLGPIVGASVGGYYVNPRLRGYCVTPIRDTVELVTLFLSRYMPRYVTRYVTLDRAGCC
eukprot:sb/3467959/